MSKYLVNIVLALVGFGALLFIVRILTTDGNGKGGVGQLPQSTLSAAEQPNPQGPAVKDPAKDGRTDDKGKEAPDLKEKGDKPKAAPGSCPCDCGCGVSGTCTCGAGKRGAKSYSEGYQTALDSGKPLVLWVGGFVCPPCERELTDCVHCRADTFRGDSSPCCVIAKPSGGELYRCGTITGMCSADKIKGLLSNGGNATRGANSCPGGYCDVAGQCGVGGCSAGAGCSTCGSGSGGVAAPAYAPNYGGPVFQGGFGGFQGGPMFGGGGGGCASGNCGGGGGRRGR